MGGELDAASVPGVGSSFVLVLPGPSGTIPAAVMADASRAALDLEMDRLRTLTLLRAGAAASEPDRGERARAGADDDANGSPISRDADRLTRSGRRDQLPASTRR